MCITFRLLMKEMFDEHSGFLGVIQNSPVKAVEVCG